MKKTFNLLAAILCLFVIQIKAQSVSYAKTSIEQGCNIDEALSEVIAEDDTIPEDSIDIIVADSIELNEITTIRKGILYDSGTTEFLCDGRYPFDEPEARYFTTMINGLNTNHFRLSFDFVPQQADCVLMFSDWGRNFGVHVNDDQCVYISTNNHDNHYTTKTMATPGTLTHLEIIFDHGTLSVNGEKFPIELDTNFGEDPNLSSTDCSCGETFKGTLKNIQIESY